MTEADASCQRYHDVIVENATKDVDVDVDVVAELEHTNHTPARPVPVGTGRTVVVKVPSFSKYSIVYGAGSDARSVIGPLTWQRCYVVGDRHTGVFVGTSPQRPTSSHATNAPPAVESDPIITLTVAAVCTFVGCVIVGAVMWFRRTTVCAAKDVHHLHSHNDVVWED